MGYYTMHTLSVRGMNLTEEILTALNDWLKHHQVIGYALDEGESIDYGRCGIEFYFGCSQEAKWYEHNEDMIELSKAFPDLNFCLHGVGEEQFDYWDCYYHNGESEECRVEWSIPEPKKIKW